MLENTCSFLKVLANQCFILEILLATSYNKPVEKSFMLESYKCHLLKNLQENISWSHIIPNFKKLTMKERSCSQN